MRTKDTDKMNRIIEYIDNVYFTENYIPTVQEIADYIGIAKSNVSSYLHEMAERGMIDLSGGWRGIKTEKINKTFSNLRRIPIIGEIACGTPMFAEQNIECYVTVSGPMFENGTYYGLRAKGDSMINAGIEPKDIIIVRQQNTANEGDIIVARIDDDTTLKEFYIDKANKRIRLHPQNDNLEDMYYDHVDIQGVVEWVMKSVKKI